MAAQVIQFPVPSRSAGPVIPDAERVIWVLPVHAPAAAVQPPPRRAPALLRVLCLGLLVAAGVELGRCGASRALAAEPASIQPLLDSMDEQLARALVLRGRVDAWRMLLIHNDPGLALGLNHAPYPTRASTRGAAAGLQPVAAPVAGRNLESTIHRDAGARLETVVRPQRLVVVVDSTPGAETVRARRSSPRGAP